MQLVAEQFDALIGAVSVVEAQPVRDGDRRKPRVRSTGGLEMYPWGHPDQRCQVQIRDLSRGGVGVLHDSRAGLDEAFVVELPQGPGKPILSILCKVAYWEPLASDLYALGMQFQQSLTNADLQSPLQNSADPSPGVLARIGHLLNTWRAAS